MRDQLEEALRHRDDGYGRTQRQMKAELPKRFYERAAVATGQGGFAITLDGRPTLTPGKRVPVVVPGKDIAEVMAAEWAAQGERIDAERMPMVRLVNSALESGDTNVPAMRAEVMKYVASDLLLYRAEHPQELVGEQERAWDDVLIAISRHFDVGFQPTVGILFQEQPEKTLSRLGEALDDAGLLEATALVSITSLTGSGILAIGLKNKLVGPDAAWAAAHVDEDYQERLWGVDEEAATRRRKRRVEFDAAVKLIESLRTGT